MPSAPKKNILIFLFLILLSSFFWFRPAPEGLSSQAWHLLIIFISTIFSIILKVLPVAPLTLISVTLIALTKTLPLEDTLYFYSKASLWLILLSFFLARALVQSGLALRCSYLFISYFGKRTLTLAYGLILSDLIIAPFIPSLVARSTGILYPIILGVFAQLEKSHPHTDLRRTKQFLLLSLFQGTMLSGAMFLTAMAGNPIMATIAGEVGVNIDWITWTKAAFLPCSVCLLLLPILIYRLVPPEIKETPQAPLNALHELEKMGPLKNLEKLMLFCFSIVLALWICGPYLGVHPTTAALVGLSLLSLTGVLKWKDCLEEKNAWNTFIWFGALLGISHHLKLLGVFNYFGEFITSQVAGYSSFGALALLSLTYFYGHYLFASCVAHISALFATFLLSAISLGISPALATFSFAFLSNLFGGLTHYSSGPAPVFYAAAKISTATWWKVGFYVSIFNLVIWTSLGPAWWYFLGLWS